MEQLMQSSPVTEPGNSERLWSFDIVRDNRISDRCLRKWIASERFPRPDGNIAGRNFWLRSTYRKWQADALSGRFSQTRRPGMATTAAA
jgi:hypothetical protein